MCNLRVITTIIKAFKEQLLLQSFMKPQYDCVHNLYPQTVKTQGPVEPILPSQISIKHWLFLLPLAFAFSSGVPCVCLHYTDCHQAGIWYLCCQSQAVSECFRRSQSSITMCCCYSGSICAAIVLQQAETLCDTYEETVFNGCSPRRTHLPGMKPLCTTWGQTPGTPNMSVNQKPLTAIAWFSAIFMTA